MTRIKLMSLRADLEREEMKQRIQQKRMMVLQNEKFLDLEAEERELETKLRLQERKHEQLGHDHVKEWVEHTA